MYKRFTKNMENYLRLNQGDSDNFRYAIVKELEVLSDVTLYKSLKKMDTNRYKKVATLLWAINNSSDRFPSFKAFSWELWGYGFDGQQYIVDKAELEEQLRLVGLLLSTQYCY